MFYWYGYGLYCDYNITIKPDNKMYSGICKHREKEIEICNSYKDNIYVIAHEIAHSIDFMDGEIIHKNSEKVADICGLVVAKIKYSRYINRNIQHAREHKEMITKGNDAFYGIEPGEAITLDMMHRCIIILRKMLPRFYSRKYLTKKIKWAISQIGYVLDFNVEHVITISESEDIEEEICVKNTTRGMVYHPTMYIFRTIRNIRIRCCIIRIRCCIIRVHRIVDKRALIKTYAHPLLA